ncbi:PREDICTED: ribonuclease UK114-like [Priapulus caudatus]|uniref:Ribonuclease UK114-like n=1 Tax=Priapulus caudatus TaxID=37621 RepID=A0ABM1EVZ5_PRICU|nr:PREDICTED: ribonuclease UK114-like [Priapulus caudatus]
MASKVVRRIIQTANAPQAIGPYSQAVQVNRTLYISGCLGMEAATGNMVSGGVVPEADQALINMGEILKAAGCSFNNVIKTTVLFADINDFAKVNEVYKKYFTQHCPARVAYQVANLPKAGRVEIEAVAEIGDIEDV